MLSCVVGIFVVIDNNNAFNFIDAMCRVLRLKLRGRSIYVNKNHLRNLHLSKFSKLHAY